MSSIVLNPQHKATQSRFSPQTQGKKEPYLEPTLEPYKYKPNCLYSKSTLGFFGFVSF